MSKAKKIISMLLAVVMVLSVAPVSATAAADANPTVEGVTYSTPTISQTSFSIDTSATTEVIRVAAKANSFSHGGSYTDSSGNSLFANYTIVSATPSGIPEISGSVYKHIAYAGETPALPRVRFTITGANAENVEVKANIEGITFGAAQTTSSGTSDNPVTTYQFPVQGSGALLAPHTDVVFTITYDVGEATYEAYAYSHIETILNPNGFISYHQDNSGTTKTQRYSAVAQFQSANMYSHMNMSQHYVNTLTDGVYKETLTNDETGTSSGIVLGYINYAASSGAIATGGNVLLGCGSEENTLDGSTNAYASIAPNTAIDGNEIAAIYKFTQGDNWISNKGTGDDGKLGEPIIYMDYEDTLGSLNFRMTVQNAERSDFVNLSLESVKFYTYDNSNALGIGDSTTEITGTTIPEDQITVTGYNYGNTGNTTIPSVDYTVDGASIPFGAFLMAKFDGRGPKATYMDNNTDVSQADVTTGRPIRVWVDTSASGDLPLETLTSMNLVFRHYDTRDLRAMYNGMWSGDGSSYTLKTPTLVNAYTALTMTFSKGVNPRKDMFPTSGTKDDGSAITGTEYDEFIAALQAAGSVLAQPDTSQGEIDQAALNLYLAYYNLPQPYATVNYTINHYLNNTTTPVTIKGNTVLPQTGTAPMGSVLKSRAASIEGHKAVGTTSYNTDITGQTASVTINYFYEPENYNITYYYNNPNFFEADGSTVNNNDMVGYNYNTKVDLDAIDRGSREHYDFLGWYEENLDVYDSSFNASAKVNDGTTATDITITDDDNFYALWKITPIKVNAKPITNQGAELADYNRNLGSVQLKEESEVITGFTNPGDFNIDGYFFGGYYYNYDATTMTFSNPVDWSKITFAFGDADKEIYVRMIDVNGRISFFSNGGTDVDDISFSANETVNAPADPTRLGYTFAGWWNEDYSEQYFETGSEYMANNTGFLAYAKWVANDVTISFDMGTSTSDFDTTTLQMPTLYGKADGEIDPDDVPPAPTKFGKSFAQWVIKGTSTVFDFDVETYPLESIVLEPVWNDTQYSAFVSIGAYEKLSGEYVEVVNPTAADRDGAAQVDDIVTFRMTSQTNFYTGSSVFVFMYDKNFFELVADGTDAFLLNSENEYVKGIDATSIGVTNDTLMDRVWPDTPNMDRTTYNAMMVTIDPTVTSTNYNCEPMADGTWLVEFQLRVVDAAGTGSGTVYMHNDWTRTANNIMGTMFYGWAETNDTTVADTFNNRVEPNLDKAIATITIDPTPQNETTLIANPNGGTWADGTADTITYKGNAGTEIFDFENPTREGYTLTGWAKSDDASVTWTEGYYATAEQDGFEFVAQWEPIKYTVNYYLDENATELWDSEELDFDSPIDGPFYDVEKTGYDFAGWVDADGNPVEIGVTTVPLGGIDLYGTWVPGEVNYTIIINYFNNNTQANASAKRTMKALTGSNVYIVEAAGTDPDATYVLWTDITAPNGYEVDLTNATNQAHATTPTVIAGDGSTEINVYYKAKTITYTLDANGGAYTDGTTQKTISGEYYTSTADKVAAVGDPVRTGYDFKGWNANASATTATGVRTTFGATDQTFYAIWTAAKVDVLFNAGEGVFADSTNSMSVEQTYGKAITAPTAPTRTGYNFLGWSTDGSTVITDLGTMNSTVDNELVFTAVWSIANYDVTYIADGVQHATAKADYNSTVTVIDYPADIIGYSFDGWYYNGTKYAPGQTITMPAGAVVFDGNFVEDTFTATFNANGGTFSNDSDVYTVDVLFGDSITAPSAPSRNGYKFLGWSESADSNATVIPGTMDTEGKTYYAVWKAEIWDYKVEFYYMDTEGKYGDAKADETIITKGNVASTVTYQPSAKDGFTIDAANSTNYNASANTVSGVVTVDPVLVLKVYYSRNQYKVYTTVDGTRTEAGEFYYEAPVSIADAPAKTGYTFTGWSPAVPATMPAQDQELEAVYTANPYPVVFYKDATKAETLYNNNLAFGTALSGLVTDPTMDGYTFKGWAYEGTTDILTLANETVPVGGVSLVGIWEIKSYTVNFRANNGKYEDGSDLKTTTVTFGDAVVAPEEPTRTGYTFNGWNPALPGAIADGSAVRNHLAQWTLESYTVKFVIDGTTIKNTYEYGADIEIPDETQTVKEGYTFKYWTDAQGNEVEVPTTMGDIGNNGAEVVYTAYFTIDSHNVTWNNEDGSVYEGPVSYEYSAAVAKPATDPSKTGWSFKGWKDASGKLYDAETAVPAMGTADVTYTAYFEINQYTITFNTDGGSAVTPITQNYATAVTKPADPTKTGYTFAGWDNLPATMPAENVTVNAQWTINQYTITFDSDGGTAVEAIKQDYNTAVTKPADPTKTGYTFAGWTPEVPSTMPANDMTVKAQWTINTYTVTWISDGTTVEEKDYNYGATVTRPSNPVKEGHTFAGWLSNDGILYAVGQDVPAMGAADVTYTAKWDIDSYTVTWLNEDNSVYEGPITYNYGAVVNKPATDPEKIGYTFMGWKAADGTLYGENDSVPAMGTANVTYTAYFVINQYTIVFDAADGAFTDGKSTYTIKENYNALVTKPADPTLEGYTFKGWTTVENGTEADIVEVLPAWSVTAENINYYAVWTVNVYTVTFVDAAGNDYFTVDLDYGTVIKSPEAYEGYTENPTLEHYNFKGWSQTQVPLELFEDEVAPYVIDFDATEITVPENGIKIYPAFARVVVTLAQHEGSTAIVTMDENSEDIVGYITGLETRLTKAKLLSTYLTVEGDGRLEVTLTKYRVCGTGAKVEVYDNLDDAKPVETYYIIIYGDVNGDSGIDATDSSMIGSERAGLTSWSNTASDDYDYCKVVAADIVDDDPTTPEKEGIIDGQDSYAIDEVTLLLAKMDQQTGKLVYSA